MRSSSRILPVSWAMALASIMAPLSISSICVSAACVDTAPVFVLQPSRLQHIRTNQTLRRPQQRAHKLLTSTLRPQPSIGDVLSASDGPSGTGVSIQPDHRVPASSGEGDLPATPPVATESHPLKGPPATVTAILLNNVQWYVRTLVLQATLIPVSFALASVLAILLDVHWSANGVLAGLAGAVPLLLFDEGLFRWARRFKVHSVEECGEHTVAMTTAL
mmetsp:Transcript_30964/g.90040  ORF Transcript_30964/g.90040 Transcript_30964/m.90040 type:complete len:219 (+) Transcript_30964:160-816(+)